MKASLVYVGADGDSDKNSWGSPQAEAKPVEFKKGEAVELDTKKAKNEVDAALWSHIISKAQKNPHYKMSGLVDDKREDEKVVEAKPEPEKVDWGKVSISDKDHKDYHK